MTTSRGIEVRDVMTTIRNADPDVSEEQAAEIAGALDWDDGHQDGKVAVAGFTQDRASRICRTVSDLIDSSGMQKVQSSLMALLLDQSVPPAPGRNETETQSPTMTPMQAGTFQGLPAEAIFLELQIKELESSGILAVHTELRTACEELKGQLTALSSTLRSGNPTRNILMVHEQQGDKLANLRAGANHLQALATRLASGGSPSVVDLRTLRATGHHVGQLAGAMKSSLEGPTFTVSYTPQVLAQIRTLGQVAQSGTASASQGLRSTGLALSQTGGGAPHPLLRGGLLILGGVAIAGGLALGLMTYSTAEASQPPVPPGVLPEAARPVTIPKMAALGSPENPIPIQNLPDATIDIESLPPVK